MTSLGSRIKDARKAKKLTQREIAEAFSISRPSVTLWEQDLARPDSDKLPRLADLLGIDLAWLMNAEGTGPIANDQGPARLDVIARPLEKLISGSDLVGAVDLPVFAGAQGGQGHLIVTFDAIDYVKRPEPRRNVKNGYGLLISGTSMVPAYRPGDIALMHPHLQPARDTEVVLYHTPPSGEAEAIIKTLVGFNDREWTLEQYNPARTFTEFRNEWPVCHRAVGKYSAR